MGTNKGGQAHTGMATGTRVDPEKRRRQILAQVAGVSSLAVGATKVIALVQDPEVDIDEVRQAIEYDPSLTADILRMANSAAFGGSVEVSSIEQAIMRFGLEWVYRFVLASAVGPIASRPVRGYDLPAEALWWHSVAVAAGTEELVRVLGHRPSPYAFTAGLLHDLGKTVMGTYLKIDLAAVDRVAAEEGISFDAAERAVLGIDHAEVGADLLEQWNLPDRIVKAVRHHHCPGAAAGEDPDCLIALVHLADALCMELGIGLGRDGLSYRCDESIRLDLGVTGELGEQVIAGIQGKLEELREFFRPEQEC